MASSLLLAIGFAASSWASAAMAGGREWGGGDAKGDQWDGWDEGDGWNAPPMPESSGRRLATGGEGGTGFGGRPGFDRLKAELRTGAGLGTLAKEKLGIHHEDTKGTKLNRRFF